MCGAKTAEPIEMLFGVWTHGGPRNNILGVGPELSTEGAHLGEGYTWVWPGSSTVSIINLACKVDAATGYRSRMQARI